MAGLFANILLDEGVVRDRALNFLSVKMKLLLAEDLLTKDIEELFIQHCKKVCNQSAKFHNSFIPHISIAPLQVIGAPDYSINTVLELTC